MCVYILVVINSFQLYVVIFGLFHKFLRPIFLGIRMDNEPRQGRNYQININRLSYLLIHLSS